MVDLITDMPPSQGGHRYILVAVDCFSKWVELIPLFTKESGEVASALYHHLFARFGKPKWIRCDAGKEFEGLVTSLSSGFVPSPVQMWLIGLNCRMSK